MKRFRLGSLLLSLLLVSSPALANNTADEADVAFDLGNEAYARGNYTEALRSYFNSYRLVPNRNVLFNIARCYEAQGKFNEAYRYYNDLATESLATDDAEEVQHSLERLRNKVALVRVNTSPKGADVFVDRVDLGSRGRSPQTLALSPGRHKIFVKRDGYRQAEATVTLMKGRSVTQDFDLQLITGVVELTGSPAGAEVRQAADGPVVAKVPGKLRLAPGRQMLFVSAPDHAQAQYLVDVPADASVTQQVQLAAQEKPTGRIVVTANRDSASVRVDGQPAGFTPTVLTLAEGEHRLEVESRDTSPLRQSVTVVAGQEIKIHAELRYAPPPVRAASKSLLSVDEAPASITVLSQEELRAFGWSTLTEALAGVRGFFLSNDRMYTYLGVRGFAPPGDLNTRVQILWDGHSMNDVWAGQGYAARDLNVDLDEVERIEVVRGPGSALYGTGAFFAVINVVPRDSLGADNHLELTGAVGALGTTRLHATAAYEKEGRSVLVSAAGLRATGAETTRVPLDGGPQRVDGLDGERAAGGSLRVRLGGLTLMAQVNGREKSIPTGPYGTALGAAGTQVTDIRAFAEARYEKALGPDVELSLRGGFDLSRYRGYWMYPATGGTAGFVRSTDAGRADWVTAEARLALKPFASNQLTFGLEGQAQLRVEQESFAPEGTTEQLPAEARTLVSAYMLDEWRLHPRLSVSAGLRVDKYLDLDVVPLTPRLAVIARPYDAGLTKLVAGRAFRAPNVYELFYSDNLVTQRPAEKLNPETITTFELEHAHDLTDELRVTVAGYHNRIANLVVLQTDQRPTPGCGSPVGTEQCLVFANGQRETLAWGAEAGLHWQPGRFLMVDLSYSYVTLKDAEQEVAESTPAHLASGRLMLPVGNGDMRLAAQAVYQSARPVGDGGEASGEALLLGFGVSGDYGRLRYFAGVQNLLDEKYALPLGAQLSPAPVPQYGRTFNLQLSGTF